MLTEKELAKILNVSVQTVRRMRKRGEGPAHIKIGRLIRYRVEDIERWRKG